jgi:hypothetical protein
MSFTHSKSFNLTTASGQVTGGSRSVTGEMSIEADVAILDSATDDEVDMTLDVTQVSSFFIISDQDITLETNNGTTPDNTLALKANKEYNWDAASYDTFKLTVDVTDFFFTNASGSTANVKIRILIDATP